MHLKKNQKHIIIKHDKPSKQNDNRTIEII